VRSRAWNNPRARPNWSSSPKATAAQLERLVRGYRRVLATERAAAGGGPPRWLRWSEDDDGSLLIQARLSAEDGALVLKALEAGVDRLAEQSENVESVSAEAPDGDGHVSAEAPAPPSLAERRADALVLMANSSLAHRPAAHAGDRYQVVVHIDAETLRHDSHPGRADLDDGAPLAPETARRLACDATILPLLERHGRPLSIGRKTRAIPTALRRALTSRDRGCRFPGCNQRHHVDAHHIEHWAHGGKTSLPNLVLLCRYHHRLLHEGGYTLEHSASSLTFRRPDGRRIRQYHPPYPATATRAPNARSSATLAYRDGPASRSISARASVRC
jgi:hypothetical protein